LSRLDTSENEEEEEVDVYNQLYKLSNTTKTKEAVVEKQKSKFSNQMCIFSKLENHENKKQEKQAKYTPNYTDNMVHENDCGSHPKFLKLQDEYNKVQRELEIVFKSCNEYVKMVEILKNVVILQKETIDKCQKENEVKWENSQYELVKTKTENECLSRKNIQLKSLVLNMFQKLAEFESKEKEHRKGFDQSIIQLLKENEYLRKCNETFTANVYIQEVKEENAVPISLPNKKKNRRSTTLVNFDFLNNPNTEDQTIDNEITLDTKVNRKRTTRVDTSASSSSSSTSSTDSNSQQNNSKPAEQPNPNTNYLSKKLDSHQTNIKPRQQYLFFKTPNNEESKKFDFSNKEAVNAVIDEAKKSVAEN